MTDRGGGVESASSRQAASVGDLELARRLERDDATWSLACARAMAEIEPASQAAWLAVTGGYALFTGVGSPLSEAKGLGMRGAVSSRDLNLLDEFYRSRSCPARIQVCPLADASLLEVTRRGYRLAEFENMLALRLAHFASRTSPDRRLLGKTAGVAAEPVEVTPVVPGEEELWVRVGTRGFADDEEKATALAPLYRAIARPAGVTTYLARLAGRAVGAAGLGMRDGLAALFGAGVLGDSRCRGAHTALVRARLEAALAAGAEWAWVGAKPGSASQRNLERLGFRIAYTRATLIRD